MWIPNPVKKNLNKVKKIKLEQLSLNGIYQRIKKCTALQEHGITCSKLKVCCRSKVKAIAHPNFVWWAKKYTLGGLKNTHRVHRV